MPKTAVCHRNIRECESPNMVLKKLRQNVAKYGWFETGV